MSFVAYKPFNAYIRLVYYFIYNDLITLEGFWTFCGQKTESGSCAHCGFTDKWQKDAADSLGKKEPESRSVDPQNCAVHFYADFFQ